MEKITLEMKIGIILALIGFVIMSYGIWLLWQVPPPILTSNWCATVSYIEPTIKQVIVLAGISIEVVGLTIILAELFRGMEKP